jgi:hypothetical protein
MVMTEGSVGVAGVAGVSGSANIALLTYYQSLYGRHSKCQKDIIIAALSNED